jgi:Flp pilus assembly pilin Flp
MEEITNIFRDDSAASSVEYGLMIFLIALVIFVSVGLLGTSVSSLFTNFNSQFSP